jgi:hypothetical protein
MAVAETRALGEAAMRGAGIATTRILTDHVLDARVRLWAFRPSETFECHWCPDFQLPRRPIKHEPWASGHEPAAIAKLSWAEERPDDGH